MSALCGQSDALAKRTAATAARALNCHFFDDQAFLAARDGSVNGSGMHIDGDPSRREDWLAAIIDPIVNRTD